MRVWLGAAWAALVAAALLSRSSASAAQVATFCQLRPATGAAASLRTVPLALVGGPVMVVAMMLPVVGPALDHLARNSLPRRRRRAAAAFLASYVGIWTVAVGVAVLALGALRDRLPTPTGRGDLVLFGVLATAALWQAAPLRRRLLRRCRRARPLAADGWAATRDASAFGAAMAGRCLTTCGALMVVTLAGVPAGLAVMALITAYLWIERTRPGAAVRLAGPSTAVLAAGAVLALAV
jgi:predicted metal-binding membrane protein